MDLGILLKEILTPEDLAPLRNLVKEAQGSRLGLPDLLAQFAGLKGFLSGVTDTWYPSSLVFLKIRTEIGNSGGYWRGPERWYQEWQELDPAAFAEAALLAGHHFEFKAFAEPYWHLAQTSD